MRHIPISSVDPNSDWLKKAQSALNELRRATDDDERKEIIDRYSRVWGELKDWLLKQSHQKCWFTEARDCVSHWEVEHFRPKKSAKDLDGSASPGYWWLAFDWKNFRICGNVPNRKKGAYFPLKPGSNRAQNESDDLRHEIYLLLDPSDPDDPALLWFDVLGNAIPHPSLTNSWDKKRVTDSVTRYCLDFPALVDRRKAIWNECWNHMKVYLDELERVHKSSHTNLYAISQLKEKARAIREMLKPDREFSTVARACVAEFAIVEPRVSGLLTST